MHVSYDRYIRTTDDYHIETVQKIFKRLYDLGYIYKGEYKGKYCTPCESFWTDVPAGTKTAAVRSVSREVRRGERKKPTS